MNEQAEEANVRCVTSPVHTPKEGGSKLACVNAAADYCCEHECRIERVFEQWHTLHMQKCSTRRALLANSNRGCCMIFDRYR